MGSMMYYSVKIWGWRVAGRGGTVVVKLRKEARQIDDGTG